MAKKTSSAKKRATLRVLIVEARFYEAISDALLAGATRVLDEAGATYDRIAVPGALEVPAAIAMAVDAAQRKRAPYDGVVALGCVIQGETYHFELVSNESARGLMDLSVNQQLAIGNGILTVDNEAQAHARSTDDGRNKGASAARAALTMVALKRKLAGR
jgi:6,7-dimethyl-8-ribityllumazine synthase